MLVPSTIAAIAVLSTGAFGQSTSASTTTSSAAPTHTVSVGALGFKFTPNSVTNASVGDIIEFWIYPGGHAVARSDFGQPCIPYEYTGLNRVGFFSGDISPQIIDMNNLPKYQVRVNDTDPIWLYCTAPGSCFQQHMIGVINPTSNQTLDMQMQYVLNATYQVKPGEPLPSETLSPTHSPSATSSSSGNNTGGAGTADDHGHGLSTGAIAGIAIGGAAVLVLAGALLFLCGRRGGLDRAYRRSTQTFPPPMTDLPKYHPKSPGQETFTAQNYSPPMSHDPYHTNSPHIYASSPPPISTSPNSNGAYATYSSAGGHPNVQSPLMAGMADGTHGYYPGITPPPAEIQAQARNAQAAPVELPTSNDPGNSPLPGYKPGRQYSWSQGQETQYRPGNKA